MASMAVSHHQADECKAIVPDSKSDRVVVVSYCTCHGPKGRGRITWGLGGRWVMCERGEAAHVARVLDTAMPRGPSRERHVKKEGSDALLHSTRSTDAGE